MKTRKPVFSFAFGLLLSVSAQAKDYYVSINGTGNGSSASQPANITALRNYLATYNVRTDYPNSRQLNVYFGGGTYTVSSGGWKFSAAAANVSGLHVRFAPVSGNAVTFQGARQNCKFLEMPAGVKADSSLSVTMENVTVRNFKSIAAGISGESSLFVVGQYNKLNLNTVTITDISSNRMPLFWIGAGAEVNVNHSVINNISSSTSSFETAKNASTLNIRHTSMSGWSMGRFMFELYNQQATLTMDSCSIQNNSMAFLFNNYATGRVELKNLVFSNNKTANYPYIDMRGGNMNVSRCTFEKNGITSGNNDFFHLEGTKYQIDHCVFNNNTAGDDFFELAANATVDQCKFTGNTTRGKHFFLLKTATVVTDCIFDGNTLTASDIDNALIYQLTPGVDKPFVMSGSTFSGNEITRAITRCYLFTTHAGMSAQDFCTLIINNTFSNHPDVTEAISIRTSENTFRGGVVNNTFYRSRGVRLGNDNSTPTRHVIANNLLIEGSIVSATGKPDYFVRNIFNNTYYATGLGGGVALGNLSAFVAPALIPYAAGKPGVHALVLTSGNNPILGKGGNRADPLNQEWIQYLRLDQRKKQRPPNLSAGAWDLTALEITDGDYTVFYDSDTGILPEYTIDLSRYIVMYPDSADRDHLLFHILSQPQNGTVRIDTANRYLLHFAPHTEQGNPGKPAAGMIGLKAQMSYHAEYTGGGVAYSQNPGLSITIRDIRQHPGITDETQVRCYTGMGQTDFVAEDKFISGNV
ncbi:MAG: hypothetical protein LBR08_07355, partial [Bacteroidales bacterium]|nr:hypothetical protein [Bacteroidales bacterium]